jgi:hypothetical protein
VSVHKVKISRNGAKAQRLIFQLRHGELCVKQKFNLKTLKTDTNYLLNEAFSPITGGCIALYLGDIWGCFVYILG